MGWRRRLITRVLAASVLALSTLGLATTPASAVPTQADVRAAKEELSSLYSDLDLLVEQYNQAESQLQQTKAELQEIRATEAQAQADAATATRALASRASSAYMERGSQLDVLLGAGSFSDFSDRLAFVSQLQQADADAAATAESATQRAQWAASELEKAEDEQASLVQRISDKKDAISRGIGQQKQLVARLGDAYERAVERRQAAQEKAARAAAPDADGAPSSGSVVDTTGGNGGSGAPPASSGGAQAAIAAAYSVLGTRYVWGGASPSGFDCSGLTMWAWQHGGVSLPHNSQAQYAATARVDRGNLQPGDLVFFYSPISHVSLYIGGGQMIDASHPGPGGEVQVKPVYWSAYAGAGRP